jgi:dTDP-4-dehydrorhamnose reductase
MNKPINKTVLIVGADSKIGKYVWNNFKNSSSINLLGTSYKSSNFFKLDLNNFNKLDKFIPKPVGKLVALFFAGKTVHSYCEKYPEETRHINVTQTLKLTEILNSYGYSTVHFSSTHVFSGEKAFMKIHEPTNPKSIFGQQKAELEKVLLSTDNNMIIRVTKILNLLDNPFADWISNLKLKNLITPYKDYPISPISVTSFLSGISNIIQNSDNGLWHLGNSEQIDYAGIALSLAKKLKLDFRLVQETLNYEKLPHYPKYSSLDISATEQLTSWVPENIEKAIDATRILFTDKGI